MPRKKSARKYQLTINNPSEKGYTHEKLKSILLEFKNVKYWCMCDEIGENGTYHTHVFIIFGNTVMFDTIRNRFYGAHIEKSLGNNEENYNYVRKIGDKYKDKKSTNIEKTFEENGELPPDGKNKTNTSEEILDMIANGCSNFEIINTIPSALNKLQYIEKARQEIQREKHKDEKRDITVTYISGAPGTGKTRHVMDKYGYSNVYRVTNYKNPFDGYNGEAVILFDEFRDSLPISDMLNYLDIYPVMLPCRYADKIALYDTVYIISNIPIEKQYVDVQKYENSTYKAFRRRIQEIYEIV